MEEHVLTTNLGLDKSGGAGLPLWIISLDLSKAFDTVKWETLWEALHRFYSAFITIKQVSFAMVLVLAESLTYYLVCDKDAC